MYFIFNDIKAVLASGEHLIETFVAEAENYLEARVKLQDSVPGIITSHADEVQTVTLAAPMPPVDEAGMAAVTPVEAPVDPTST